MYVGTATCHGASGEHGGGGLACVKGPGAALPLLDVLPVSLSQASVRG